MARGIVYLVGAGPGDPGLITVHGLQYLRQAEVVVHDRLVVPELLAEAPADCELVYAGKNGYGNTAMTQAQINELLVARGRAGQVVCRLKGGDPFVFGRGGEEAIALADAGVPFEVVPGVTAGAGVLAYAGIPVTHRGVASAALFVTGHDVVREEMSARWCVPGDAAVTLVVYMGLAHLDTICERLLAYGRSPATPAAVIGSGTLPQQQTAVGTLADIARRAAGIQSPAIVVVGDVVTLRERMRYREVYGRLGIGRG